MSAPAPTLADCNALAALLGAARGGSTAIPLAHLGSDGPTIASTLERMGADDEDVDDILSRGAW